MFGSFDEMFDFNNDGKLTGLERAAEADCTRGTGSSSDEARERERRLREEEESYRRRR